MIIRRSIFILVEENGDQSIVISENLKEAVDLWLRDRNWELHQLNDLIGYQELDIYDIHFKSMIFPLVSHKIHSSITMNIPQDIISYFKRQS